MMNELLDKVSKYIIGDNLTGNKTDSLRDVCHHHPYFSVAQLLHAKEYSAGNHAEFNSQAQKAALYFSNSFLLHSNLSEKSFDITFDNSVTEQVEEPANNPSQKSDLQYETQAAPTSFTNDLKTGITPADESPSTEFSNEELTAASSLAKETLSAEAIAERDEVESLPDELHPEHEDILEEIAEERKDDNDITGPDDNTGNVDQEEFVELPTPEKDLIETVVEESLIHPATIAEPEVIVEPIVQVTEKNEVSKNTTTTAETGPLIPIEPYYTVDYFASQGIKFVPDKNPQDKLGKQLRSFTEWLKHMKKLGPEDALKNGGETEVDSTIKTIADTSNTPEEIVTEAMADVLIKQGKTQQAIEVYNKLSFLNPDKSAYFANQIQKLKGL